LMHLADILSPVSVRVLELLPLNVPESFLKDTFINL
jgi:hypothetical protein